jgi:type 1 fimbria pilin
MSSTNSSPIISSVYPPTVKVHADNVTLTVKGDNFNAGCDIDVDGSFLVTIYVNAGKLTAVLPRAITDVQGRNDFLVHDTNSGDISNSASFDVVP